MKTPARCGHFADQALLTGTSRSSGRRSCARPRTRRYRGTHRAAARGFPCRTWVWWGSGPAPRQSRAGACFADGVGQAVIQRIPVLAEMGGQVKLRGQQLEDVRLGLGMRQVGIEEMGTQRLGGCLQVRNTVGAYGLHDIGANVAQRRFGGLTKWRVHLRDSF